MIDSGGGAIVNVSSLYGILGSRGHPDTMHQKVLFGLLQKPPRLHMALKAFALMTPMQRMGESVEVANAMLFLASDEASYITGSELIVDGGLMPQ